MTDLCLFSETKKKKKTTIIRQQELSYNTKKKDNDVPKHANDKLN